MPRPIPRPRQRDVYKRQLINSAFDYLLERRELPTAAPSSRPSREELDIFLAASTLDVDWRGEAADGDYRSLVRDGKRARYESLA